MRFVVDIFAQGETPRHLQSQDPRARRQRRSAAPGEFECCHDLPPEGKSRMKPVTIIAMPHNGRGPLHSDDPADSERALAPLEYLDLPIQMPASAQVTYGKGGLNDILAIHCH